MTEGIKHRFRFSSDDAIFSIVILSALHYFLFVVTGYPDGLSLVKVIVSLPLLLAGVIMMIFGLIGFSRFLVVAGPVIAVTFAALFFWGAGLYVRSAVESAQNWVSLLGNYTVAWVWMAPLLACIGVLRDADTGVTRSAFFLAQCCQPLLFLGIALSLVGLSPANYWAAVLQVSAVCLFLFCVDVRDRNNHRWIVFIASATFLVSSFYEGYRINFVLFLFIVVGIRILRARNLFNRLTWRVVLLAFFVSVIVASAYFLSLLSEEAAFSSGGLLLDTRTFLVIELFSELTPVQEIMGKGAMGRYFSPFFANFADLGLEGDSWDRLTVEIGYLKMILKGGWILVILTLLVLIPLFSRGIISENIRIRCQSLFGFMFLLGWLISLPPRFTPIYVMLWVSVGWLVRKLSNSTRRLEIGNVS